MLISCLFVDQKDQKVFLNCEQRNSKKRVKGVTFKNPPESIIEGEMKSGNMQIQNSEPQNEFVIGLANANIPKSKKMNLLQIYKT